MIHTWTELEHRVLTGQLEVYVFEHGYMATRYKTLFSPEVTAKIKTCDPQSECMKLVLKSNQPTAWLDYLRYIHLESFRFGVRSLPVSLESAALETSGAELYTVGEGLCLSSEFESVLFSQHRTDFQRRVQPWLQAYYELGHLAWWETMAEVELEITLRRLTAHAVSSLQQNCYIATMIFHLIVAT